MVHRAKFPTVGRVDILADDSQRISVDQFVATKQNHPHAPWRLNGEVLQEVTHLDNNVVIWR